MRRAAHAAKTMALEQLWAFQTPPGPQLSIPQEDCAVLAFPLSYSEQTWGLPEILTDDVGGISMKFWICVLILLSLGTIGFAQDHSSHTMAAKPATLVTGLGDLHHPVSTKNVEAQKFFDQGLRYIYAFNHDEAARSFTRATQLDPKLAIAYWGIAEAVGPNYNDPASADRFKAAHEAIQKAVDLEANASPSEKAYIEAMALRFPADP